MPLTCFCFSPAFLFNQKLLQAKGVTHNIYACTEKSNKIRHLMIAFDNLQQNFCGSNENLLV